MHRKLLRFLISIAVLGITFLSNSAGTPAQASSQPDRGALKGSAYTNAYFGLNLTVPAKWQVQNKETLEQIKKIGSKALAGNDRNMRAALEKDMQNTVPLITIFQYPLGSPKPYNPSFNSVAEKVSQYPGIKRGSDYLNNMKKVIGNSQLTIDYQKAIYSTKIGNKSFDAMELSFNYGKQNIKQIYYSTIIKGYAVSFVISYTTQEELNSLKSIIKSIKFA